jgi:hypothetical protein
VARRPRQAADDGGGTVIGDLHLVLDRDDVGERIVVRPLVANRDHIEIARERRTLDGWSLLRRLVVSRSEAASVGAALLSVSTKGGQHT